jgi:hypothetical protein
MATVISTITPAQTLSERAGIFALNTYALLSKVNNQLPNRDIPENYNIIKPVFCLFNFLFFGQLSFA